MSSELNTLREQEINAAKEAFGALLESQLKRVDGLYANRTAVDLSKISKVVIGTVGGDGIGPSITGQAARVLRFLLADAEKSGRVEFRDIAGLTLENRLACEKAIPDECLEELMKCHVILKGPTTTPQAGDYSVNIESANVAMRKALDLFANVRPVRVPEQGIDWVFFRENTEGAYAVGNAGVEVNNDLAVDFTVTTTLGSERIIRAAFEYAKSNNRTRVTAVTKANVIKTTDGKFLKIFKQIASLYTGISADEWYIDIMTAKLIDEERRRDFQVVVLPNLYGDILTDEAAQIQGGVGTAGSANLGSRYAMFEAIHGSAPRMVKEGREIYADPASIMRAAAMLLGHIGYRDKEEALNRALDHCISEKPCTGRPSGATTHAFADFIMQTVETYL